MIASNVVNVPINNESSRVITLMLQFVFPARQSNLWLGCPEFAIANPPEQCADTNQRDQCKQHDQRRYLDPRDRRYEKPHDEAKHANLPRRNMHAGDECSE